MALLGYPRGHRIDSETRCCLSKHTVPNECMDTLPRTRASQNRWATTEAETWEITWVLYNAQAACVFKCSASKPSSFFQRVRAMAAILRAKVSFAISGLMPLSSKAT